MIQQAWEHFKNKVLEGPMKHLSARKAADIRQRLPVAVELPVPSDGWLNAFNRHLDWAAKHAGDGHFGVLARVDASAGKEFARFHFPGPDLADRFRTEFGGERINVADKPARRRKAPYAPAQS